MSIKVTHWHWHVRLTTQVLVSIPSKKPFLLIFKIRTMRLPFHWFMICIVSFFTGLLSLFLFLFFIWFWAAFWCESGIARLWSSFVLSKLVLATVSQTWVKFAFKVSESSLNCDEHMFSPFVVRIQIRMVPFSKLVVFSFDLWECALSADSQQHVRVRTDLIDLWKFNVAACELVEHLF